MKTTTCVMQRTARHASTRDQIASTSLCPTTSATKGIGVPTRAFDITYDPTVIDFFGNDVVDAKNNPTRSASGSPPG